MGAFIDLAGLEFGRLTVMQRLSNDKSNNSRWLCQCACGNRKEIIGKLLRNGHVRSCGCLFKEGKNNFKHGHRGIKQSRTYTCWCNMVERCTNKNHKQYKDYGGRDKPIKIGDRWDRNRGGSFGNFLEDMGESPGKGYSIDRIDNNLGYFKENCRWVTSKINNRNRRDNRFHYYNGKEQCTSALAEEYGISPQVLSGRIKRGWPIKRALTTPVKKYRKKIK